MEIATVADRARLGNGLCLKARQPGMAAWCPAPVTLHVQYAILGITPEIKK